jgi:predicted outer membrane repeat protein
VHLIVPADVTVTIATRGEGSRAVIDGEHLSRLFYVLGHLRLIAVVLIRGAISSSANSQGGAIYAQNGASVHVSGSVISDCTASTDAASNTHYVCPSDTAPIDCPL